MRLYWRFAASSSRRWLDLTLNEICVMFLIHLSTFCVLPAIFFMWPKLEGLSTDIKFANFWVSISVVSDSDVEIFSLQNERRHRSRSREPDLRTQLMGRKYLRR